MKKAYYLQKIDRIKTSMQENGKRNQRMKKKTEKSVYKREYTKYRQNMKKRTKKLLHNAEKCDTI